MQSDSRNRETLALKLQICIIYQLQCKYVFNLQILLPIICYGSIIAKYVIRGWNILPHCRTSLTKNIVVIRIISKRKVSDESMTEPASPPGK